MKLIIAPGETIAAGTYILTTQPAPINGAVGSANGVAVPSAPTSNLCSAGAPTAVRGTGPWTWSCVGANGGTTAQGSAPLLSPARTLAIGFYGGNGVDGVNHLRTLFQPFLGRVPDLAVDFIAFDSWASLESDAGWAIGFWTGVVPQLSLAVPLTVNGTALADVAAGQHDASFQVIANALVKAGFGHAIIRLGWEANGGWYPWGNLSTNATLWAAYIAAFRHVVGVFRAISTGFTFDWCTAAGWQQTGDKSVLYPGDDVVDYVGMDVEPQVWGVQTPSQALCWTALTQGWSLDWLPGFAKAHGKRISFPEFGIGSAFQSNGTADYGPGDNGALATQLLSWAKTNAVAYLGVWDWNGTGDGDYASQMSGGAHPNVAAAFKAALA